MSAAAHELRVLDGLHAGARAPLEDDSSVRVAIGSAWDNDIVLSDPGIDGRHALLQWDAGARRWHLLADEQAAPGLGHALGEPVALGPVRVTVAAANDRFELHPGPAEPEPALVDEPVHEEVAEAEVAISPMDRPRRRWQHLLVLGCGLLVALVAAGLWQFSPAIGEIESPARPAPPATATPIAAVQAATPDYRSAVHAVLKAQGLDTALQVQGSAAKPVVTGLLADAATLETLAQALARLTPRPGLQVGTIDQLRAALRDGGLRVPATLQMSIDASGALRLSGPIASEAAAIDLQQRVQTLLPAGVPVQAAFDTPAGLAARFIADAQAQGFKLDGRFDGQQLALTLDLPESDQARWEQWLATRHKQLAGALRFTATLRSAPPPPRSDQGLPFRVSSIVGGESPYLVLSDGSQLLPGAQRGDVTLLQIDNDALLLQRGSQTFKVPR
ncbi:type III secretion system inner membrane ring subunit SctD [Aquabacterium sp.]|uniref:type III secretion system inner membrane ring subunit SctD n=1 Tax=Aquabacterium sp. TaxID=1872578 RepID=UPI002BC7E456|nr:type III secretion system inner membrane ring subunit SctD [Aquabacterium sp.]HSW03474.1 type III secretion system inner membrane ring subunit SctD [Aquabacterium sp.]